MFILASLILGAQKCAAKPVECQSVVDNFSDIQSKQKLSPIPIEPLGPGAIAVCLADDSRAECIVFVDVRVVDGVKFFDDMLKKKQLKEGGFCEQQAHPAKYYFLSVERPKA
jgi:hypothetical protein